MTNKEYIGRLIHSHAKRSLPIILYLGGVVTTPLVPRWYHKHGSKVVVVNANNQQVQLRTNALHLYIYKITNENVMTFRISWILNHAWGESRGNLNHVNKNMLLCMFTMEYQEPSDVPQFLKEYGCDAGVQGKFIRSKNFLNIPCPGTAEDGDPNVSINVTPKVEQAIRILIA